MTATTTPRALSAAQAKQMEKALLLLRQGDAAGALALGAQVARDADAAPDAHQLLAMCHAEVGNAGDAEQSFRRALQLAPDHPLILLNFGAFLRKFGRSPEALGVLGRAVGVAPDFAKAWTELGVTALGLGDAAQAVVALDRAVQLQPSAFVWHALGNARRLQGELESAADAFRKSIELNPGYGSAWVNLGAVQRLLGAADQALASFERASQAGYSGPDLVDATAGALLDTGEATAGLEQARRVTREYPAFVRGHETLANLLWEYGPALAPGSDPTVEFRSAIRSRPQDHALRLAFARFLLASRQGDEALEQVRMLRAQADHPALAVLEADVLELLQRSDQAGQLYAQLHRAYFAQDPSFLNSYARHLLRAGKWDEAAACAADAARADPDNQEAWAYLATAWRLLGDEREYWLCDYDRLATLVAIDVPDGYTGMADFLDALRSSLELLHHARREPVQQSLRGGSQTPGRLFGRSDPVIAATQRSLRRAVERWLVTLPIDLTHPFLRRKASSVRICGSWSVKLWSMGRHVNHIHPEGWMSSAFYVSLPPTVHSAASQGTQAGCLQLGQPPDELGLDLPPRRVIRPEPGTLALFPSYLWHGTVPFQDRHPRLTIAFDMAPIAPHS